jgi:hypothetical protein
MIAAGGDQQHQPRNGRAMRRLGWRGAAREGLDDRDLGDGASGTGGREEGRDHGDRHGDEQHRPRKLEQPYDMVRARFEVGPIGGPQPEADHGAERRSHHADHGTVGAYNQTDVAVGATE